MADTKFTALPEMTTPADADIMPIVDDPGGTPASQKITWANIKAAIKSYYDSVASTLTNKTFDANGTGNSLSNVETADLAASSKSGVDATLITGTKGTANNVAIWNADGDLVDSSTAEGDIVTPSSTDTLTNKTFDANGTGNSLSNVETADLAASSKSGSDATLVTGTAGTSGNCGQWNADGDLVDGKALPSGAIVGSTDTQTLTNKRITPRVSTEASSATPTPPADSADQYQLTALAEDATFAAPSGTPTNGQKLIIRILDNGTARSLSWNAIYRAIGVTLPTTTTISKTIYVGLIFNSADTKWDAVSVVEEA